MARDGVDGHLSELVAAEQRAEHRAGVDELAGEDLGWEAQPGDDLAGPCAAARVEQPGGRGVRGLVGELAAEPVGERVGQGGGARRGGGGGGGGGGKGVGGGG